MNNAPKKPELRRLRIKLFLFLVIMLIFISAFAGYLFKIELEKKPIIKQKLDSNEIDYIYDFYTDAPPNHRDMAFLGDDDAPIKFVAYLDIASGSSKFFILSILPLLK